VPSQTLESWSQEGEDYDVLVMHPRTLEFFCASQIHRKMVKHYQNIHELGSTTSHRVHGKTDVEFILIGESLPEINSKRTCGDNWLCDYEIYTRKNEQIIRMEGVVGWINVSSPTKIEGFFK
jgi:hypothetical protein